MWKGWVGIQKRGRQEDRLAGTSLAPHSPFQPPTGSSFSSPEPPGSWLILMPPCSHFQTLLSSRRTLAQHPQLRPFVLALPLKSQTLEYQSLTPNFCRFNLFSFYLSLKHSEMSALCVSIFSQTVLPLWLYVSYPA